MLTQPLQPGGALWIVRRGGVFVVVTPGAQDPDVVLVEVGAAPDDGDDVMRFQSPKPATAPGFWQR